MHIVSRQPSERRPARMGRLAVLPLFLSLEGRRAIVFGATPAAAWKAELLAAAGARVEVYAPSAGRCAALSALAADCDVERPILLHDCGWSRQALIGASLVVADAADDAQAMTIAEAARQQGVPCNIVDRPAYSQFQFGAIVNRSPVVVGISTAGAAPILAQAIRQRIESMLPASLAAWAALALRLRARLSALLEPGRRRAFWEYFAAKAFGAEPIERTEAELFAAASHFASASAGGNGRVTLVGAGPGDAELLTLKAMRALQSADVILFDELVSDAVLDLARREARRMLVGKRGGRESCRQQDINDLMIKLAKAGKHVVRLKSGDPMLFARAGEEIARLQDEAIPYDIVPGVTSALAMAATLGVSLTHRDHAQSVQLVTGHSRHGRLPEHIDWKAIADPAQTTIFYMGGRTAGQIARRLIGEGLARDTPVAVASSVSRPDQRVGLGQLEGLSTLVAALNSNGPILVGIGRVFAASTAACIGAASADTVVAPPVLRAHVAIPR